MEHPALGYGLFVVGVVLALLALLIVGLNYNAIYLNRRNRQRGIDKHSSMIFLLPQILAAPAYMIFQHFPAHPAAGWIALGIALADPSIWTIVALPLWLLFRR